MLSKSFKRIGKHHSNYCEDSVGQYEVGSHRKMILCCDGCSMGNQSHYVSELIQKITFEIAREEYYHEYGAGRKFEMDILLQRIVKEIFVRLKQIFNITGRNKYDYLSTIIIGIVDRLDGEYIYLVAGDGVVCVDNSIEIFDQNNQPDYIGYHLEDEFDKWFNASTVVKRGKLTLVLSIATDGIFTFTDNYDTYLDDGSALKVMHSLLYHSGSTNNLELQNEVDKLLVDKGWSHNDDIAIAKLELL